jgi:hypothetical protein
MRIGPNERSAASKAVGDRTITIRDENLTAQQNRIQQIQYEVTEVFVSDRPSCDLPKRDRLK